MEKKKDEGWKILTRGRRQIRLYLLRKGTKLGDGEEGKHKGFVLYSKGGETFEGPNESPSWKKKKTL